MTATRLQDAVISVRIETGKARSELRSLKSDVSDIGGSQRTAQGGAGGFFPGGGSSYVGGSGTYGGTPGKTPGRSNAPPSFGGGGAGSNPNAPGEFVQPLRYLRAAQELRTLVQGKSPQEILSAAGGIVEQMPGFLVRANLIGTAMRAGAAAPDALVAALELAAFAGPSKEHSDALAKEIGDYMPDFLGSIAHTALVGAEAVANWATGGGVDYIKGTDYFKAFTGTTGTLSEGLRLATERSNYKGDWARRDPDEQSVSFERAQRLVDSLIANIVSTNDAFGETRAQSSYAAIAAGKAYTKGSDNSEFNYHWNRNAEFSAFMYRFNRRNQRAMFMQSGVAATKELLGPGLAEGFGNMMSNAIGRNTR